MLICFEGIDGVGKSTQIELLSRTYTDAIITKEPGGTALGVKLREILLSGDGVSKISARAEILLFLADRAEHYHKIIKPNKSKMILSDRSFISGIAYALANDNGLDIKTLIELNRFALFDDLEAKFIFLKASGELIKSRLKSRANSVATDIIESRGIKYLLNTQENMLNIFKALNADFITIEADQPAQKIHEKIKEFIR